MKQQADAKRKNVELNEGYLLFVKLQPYRQSSVAKFKKLPKREYGPFPIEMILVH